MCGADPVTGFDFEHWRQRLCDLHVFGALGPVSMLRVVVQSVGKKVVKGHASGGQLCPERTLTLNFDDRLNPWLSGSG